MSIPNSVTRIEEKAFYACKSLTDINLSNVIFIGNSAFEHCHSLTSVTIPDNIRYIGNLAFWGCKNLKIVYVRGDVEKVRKLYNFDKSVKFVPVEK